MWGSRPSTPTAAQSVTFCMPRRTACTRATKSPRVPTARAIAASASEHNSSARKLSHRARNDGLGLSSTEATGAASSKHQYIEAAEAPSIQEHGQEHAPPPREARAPLPRRRRDHPRDGRGTSGVDRLRRLGRSWERLKESISSQRHLSDRLKECPASGLSSASGL